MNSRKNDHPKELIEIANELKDQIIKSINLYNAPIEYDKLVCPKCGTYTVVCGGYNWCPHTCCDWGNEFEFPKPFTKWE